MQWENFRTFKKAGGISRGHERWCREMKADTQTCVKWKSSSWSRTAHRRKATEAPLVSSGASGGKCFLCCCVSFWSLTVIIDKMSPHLHIRSCRDARNISATQAFRGFGHALSLVRLLASVLFGAQATTSRLSFPWRILPKTNLHRDALLVVSLHPSVSRLSCYDTLHHHKPTSSSQRWLMTRLMHELTVPCTSVHPAGNQAL